MKYQIGGGISEYKVIGQNECFTYSYKIFTQSGTLKNSIGKVVASLKRKWSWLGYEFELETIEGTYQFYSKLSGDILVSNNTGENFIDGYSLPFKVEYSLVRNGAYFDFETENERHVLAFLAVCCFHASLVR